MRPGASAPTRRAQSWRRARCGLPPRAAPLLTRLDALAEQGRGARGERRSAPGGLPPDRCGHRRRWWWWRQSHDVHRRAKKMLPDVYLCRGRAELLLEASCDRPPLSEARAAAPLDQGFAAWHTSFGPYGSLRGNWSSIRARETAGRRQGGQNVGEMWANVLFKGHGRSHTGRQDRELVPPRGAGSSVPCCRARSP